MSNAATPRPKPFASALINANATHGDRPFGYTWQQVVRPVAGFRVVAQPGGIRSVENLTRADVQDAGSLAETEGVHYLILFNGEFVKQLDVVADQAGVTALRFVTNLRSTVWLGSGGKPTTSSFVAPQGYYIKLLQGAVGKHWCVQLRVLYSPLESAKPCEKMRGQVDDSTPDDRPSQFDKVPQLNDSAPDDRPSQLDKTPRAIVVPIGRVLDGIDVLSATEFAYFEMVAECNAMHSECIRSDPQEHFFVLVEGESITALAVHRTRDAMVGVRFKTNLRTSQWFGQPAASDRVDWLAVEQS